MAFKFTNKAITFLNSAVGSTATTVLLPSGDGDLFPSISGGDIFAIVFEDRLTGEFEICYCTARTGDQLTITRGEEGTIPISWPVGSNVSLRTTAAFLDEVGLHEGRITQNEADIAQLQSDLDPLKTSIFEAIYPVGSLYISTIATNPGSTMGFGTWAAHAQGRALVGVGNNGQATWAAGETRGNETHQLTVDETPSHVHSVDPPSVTTSTEPDHDHPLDIRRVSKGGDSSFVMSYDGDFTSAGPRAQNTGTGGAHDHTVDIPAFDSASVGGDQAHNNVQPSLAIYVWRRTA